MKKIKEKEAIIEIDGVPTEGLLIELDPTKWYWLIIKRNSRLANNWKSIQYRNGQIIIVDDFGDVKIVETTDRIKEIYVGDKPMRRKK